MTFRFANWVFETNPFPFLSGLAAGCGCSFDTEDQLAIEAMLEAAAKAHAAVDLEYELAGDCHITFRIRQESGDGVYSIEASSESDVSPLFESVSLMAQLFRLIPFADA